MAVALGAFQFGQFVLKLVDAGLLSGVDRDVHPEGCDADAVDVVADVGGGPGGGVARCGHVCSKPCFHHHVNIVSRISAWDAVGALETPEDS